MHPGKTFTKQLTIRATFFFFWITFRANSQHTCRRTCTERKGKKSEKLSPKLCCLCSYLLLKAAIVIVNQWFAKGIQRTSGM